MEINNLKKYVLGALSAILAFATLSFAPAASATLNLDAEGATLNFSTDDYLSLSVGETHLYENVVTIDGTDVDALITMDDLAENTESYGLDEPYTESIDTYIYVDCGDCDDEADYTPADNYKGSAQYTIQFFEAGTSTPVNLLNVAFYVRDIDTYQYIEVLDPQSYVFDAETNLEAIYPDQNADIEEGHVRFMEIGGIESEPEDQPHWVQVKFDSLSSLTYKIGQDIPGGAFFSINFAPVTFDNPEEFEAVYVEPVPVKLSKTVYFTGDSAYLMPKWFKKLDKFIASIPTCATNVTAKILSGVKKAKSEVKGNDLAKRRAAILKKFLTKRGLTATITLQPNGKGTKALNKKRFAKVVVTYDQCAN